MRDAERSVMPVLKPVLKPLVRILLLTFFGTFFFVPQANACQAEQNQQQQITAAQRQRLNRVVKDAFLQIHDGWSSDEVVLQQELNQEFVRECERLLSASEDTTDRTLNVSALNFNWALMNLRKAGKLKAKATRRKRIDVASVQHVAEIAARSLMDANQCSIDRIMCDPDLRAKFDAAARNIDSDVDTYAVRKAAFQLRKARRLKPELIGRIADWGKTINTFELDQIASEPQLLNEHPGIYIFRDDTGYLYIGQTDNLRKRLKQHLDESHNLSLAKHLKSQSSDSISIEIHDFDPESQASQTMVRRAYESELIASRKPRFNVQP